jgi:hypothetical protein
MPIRQISVFIENNAGRLSALLDELAGGGVNIKALSLADTEEFGILRFVTDEDKAAHKILNRAGWTCIGSNVIAVEIDNFTGSLARVVDVFQTEKINIEYVYSVFAWKKAGHAVLLFKTDDEARSEEILRKNGYLVLEKI